MYNDIIVRLKARYLPTPAPVSTKQGVVKFEDMSLRKEMAMDVKVGF